MKEVLEEFKKITQIDLKKILQDIDIFLKIDRIKIENYYSGIRDRDIKLSFQRFEKLDSEIQNIFEKIRGFKRYFNDYRWWELIEILEQIQDSFNSIKNYHRWNRCSVSTFGYEENLVIDYITKEGQTLEKISSNIMQDSNPSDDWYKIAIFNDLREEDYTLDGGKDLKLKFDRGISNFEINSVMDVVKDKTVYGLDIDKTLSFIYNEDGECDLLILDYDKTILQAIDILIKLKKNSNPDYPFDGLQSDIVVGGNRALFNFPIIINQLRQVFSTDDTLKNFNITNLSYDQDIFKVFFDVETRLDEVFQQEREL